MIGEKMRELRKVRGLSCREAADLLKIPNRTLVSYEYNNREPNISMIKKLADFYGVTTDELLEHERI